MRVGRRRLLAVLAGGVVLVGGGVTTLAAWQDQTSVRAPLTLSRFNVQQTLDPAYADTSFVEADTEAGASPLLLQVVGSGSNLLSPDAVATGWVGLRVDAGSVGGTVTLNGATAQTDPGGLLPQLQYQAVAGVSEATCRTGNMPPASSTVIALVAAGTSVTTGSGGVSFTLPAAASSSAAGAAVGVCIKLSLKATATRALSGSSVSPVWTFNATSAP